MIVSGGRQQIKSIVSQLVVRPVENNKAVKKHGENVFGGGWEKQIALLDRETSGRPTIGKELAMRVSGGRHLGKAMEKASVAFWFFSLRNSMGTSEARAEGSGELEGKVVWEIICGKNLQDFWQITNTLTLRWEAIESFRAGKR